MARQVVSFQLHTFDIKSFMFNVVTLPFHVSFAAEILCRSMEQQFEPQLARIRTNALDLLERVHENMSSLYTVAHLILSVM